MERLIAKARLRYDGIMLATVQQATTYELHASRLQQYSDASAEDYPIYSSSRFYLRNKEIDLSIRSEVFVQIMLWDRSLDASGGMR
jgi:aspartyl/asparaginyl-tRNA synthetase